WRAYTPTIGHEDPTSYKSQWAMGGGPADIAGGETLLWFNGEPFHFGAAALGVWQTAILKYLLASNSTGSPVPVSVNINNHPLGTARTEGSVLLFVMVRFASVLPISLATAFLTCSLVFFPIQERISKAKLVQIMSGVHRSIYFGASFLFDLILIIISAAFMILVLVLYNPGGSFTAHNDTWLAIWVLLCTYGFTMVPLAYLFSYFFQAPGAGFAIMLGIASFCGGVVVSLVSLVDFLGFLPGNPLRLSVEDVEMAVHVLNYIPPFAVVWGFTNVHINGLSKQFCEEMDAEARVPICLAFRKIVETCCHRCNENHGGVNVTMCYKHESPFLLNNRNGAGYQLMAMAIVGVLGFFVLVLVEINPHRFVNFLEWVSCRSLRNALASSLKKKPKTSLSFAAVNTEDDSDVVAERRGVDAAIADAKVGDYAFIAHELTKFYSDFKAVDNISFRVNHNECFGLLGVNGAGKTTTFSILTGDLSMSEGNAYVADANLQASLRKFQSYIGYCPQFDALLDNMSGREMLELFCALRGVPSKQTETIVSQMISMSDIGLHANKPTSSYSGGTKRKLSIALAMIGNPAVLFLDEPTAGVDPAARRKIWATLTKAQKDLGTAIILTSHSMEECEALCSRLAIMVNGNFRCLGSSQHLKNKFGQGFTVIIKLKACETPSVVAPEVCAMMDRLFPGENKLKDSYQCLLHFHITDTSLLWSVLFEKIEQLKDQFDFEDVVVSDTSLEQIFLAFAKTQRSQHQDEMGVRLKEGAVRVISAVVLEKVMKLKSPIKNLLKDDTSPEKDGINIFEEGEKRILESMR
ncbi:ATP-binding cassette sub-family A member 1-like, partial [Tropilaelaps mercedesae]